MWWRATSPSPCVARSALISTSGGLERCKNRSDLCEFVGLCFCCQTFPTLTDKGHADLVTRGKGVNITIAFTHSSNYPYLRSGLSTCHHHHIQFGLLATLAMSSLLLTLVLIAFCFVRVVCSDPKATCNIDSFDLNFRGGHSLSCRCLQFAAILEISPG
jgi:hypothetical protein